MIGDSHAYEVTHPPARSEDVDLLILRYLKGMIALPDARIAKRWLGHYDYVPNTGDIRFSPGTGMTAVCQTSGQQMSHGFKIAEDIISKFSG